MSTLPLADRSAGGEAATRVGVRAGALPLVGAWFWLLCCGTALAQDVEPRRWTAFPVGTNVLGLGYVYGEGDISLDPVTRIDDVDFRSHSAIASYVRSFGFAGKTARIDLMVPYQNGHWEGRVDGIPQSVRRRGFGDPRIRLSVNLLGPPAMDRQQFQDYLARNPVDTTAGLAVAVSVPLGEYKKDKLINLGANRFVIRPQFGVLHKRGPWSYELTASAFFFTPNDEFSNGMERKQDPLYAAQMHVVRTFEAGSWVSAGVAYGWAGENEIDGLGKDDEAGNLLFGASLGVPVGHSQGVALRYIGGRTQKDTGSDSDRLVLAWTIRF